MTIAGSITRSDLQSLTDNYRLIKFFETLQTLVFDSPFNSIGDPVTSTTPSNISIPININGIDYYLKLSTTP